MKSSIIGHIVIMLVFVAPNGFTDQVRPDDAVLETTVVMRFLESELPVVFAKPLLHSFKLAIAADMEYILSFATDSTRVPAAENEPRVRYLGREYAIQEYLTISYPTTSAGSFRVPPRALLLIEIDGKKAVYISEERINHYLQALSEMQKDAVCHERLLAFIHAIRDVDALLALSATEKRRILPQAGEEFTVGLFDENMERLREDTFYDPPLSTFRIVKGDVPMVGARMLCRDTDKKLYTQDIVYYEGRWCFGYVPE